MAARLMWGSEGEDARAVDAEALDRAEEASSSFTFLEAGETGDAPAGPVTESEGGVPADRLIYLVEDDDTSRPIAVATERVAGNADVLAAVEEEWKTRTGQENVRVDAPATTSEEQQSPAGPADR